MKYKRNLTAQCNHTRNVFMQKTMSQSQDEESFVSEYYVEDQLG